MVRRFFEQAYGGPVDNLLALFAAWTIVSGPTTNMAWASLASASQILVVHPTDNFIWGAFQKPYMVPGRTEASRQGTHCQQGHHMPAQRTFEPWGVWSWTCKPLVHVYTGLVRWGTQVPKDFDGMSWVSYDMMLILTPMAEALPTRLHPLDFWRARYTWEFIFGTWDMEIYT